MLFKASNETKLVGLLFLLNDILLDIEAIGHEATKVTRWDHFFLGATSVSVSYIDY